MIRPRISFIRKVYRRITADRILDGIEPIIGDTLSERGLGVSGTGKLVASC
jgi:hypothetical protein